MLMYSNCIFCYANLGSNDAIEAFPVGSRVAYDPGKGRLWSVCPLCGRWNLAPLRERWEAVESAERAYEVGVLRASSDNISVAKAADATELVRIGPAPRREVASWRYGDRFLRRWKRSVTYGAVGLGVVAAFVASGTYAAMTALPGGALLLQAPGWLHSARMRRKVVARVDRTDGPPAFLRGRHLIHARVVLHASEGWALEIVHDDGPGQLCGADALRVAGPVLTHLNRAGARASIVAEALSEAESFPSTNELFQSTAERNHRRPGDWAIPSLVEMPRSHRLALEMLANDELERSALEGELHSLERAWREAEIIAAIADDLLVPAEIEERLRREASTRDAAGRVA